MDVSGNYILDVEIGGTNVQVYPQMIEELTISQDIDRIVPTFTFRVKDHTQLLGHVVPYDKGSNEITLTFSRQNYIDQRNIFVFSVKRRRVLSDGSYEVEGLLETSGLFSPSKNRALTGNLKTNLESIALDELKLDEPQIGASLNFTKTVLQPYWNNALLLRYLKERIEGKTGETCYYCFIKNVKGERILVFKSIEELLFSNVTYKFIIGAKPFEEFLPVSDFRIFDNSQFRSFFNSRVADYKYFDYNTGAYVSPTNITLENCPSLSEYYLVDKDDDTSMSSSFVGRNNDFTSDFSGRMGQSFYDSITDSIHLWISTWGIENIAPGDIVFVVFADAINRGKIFVYENSGFWMVRRVVHILGSSFMTNLLLSRSGVDTDVDTTLLSASKVRKE